jgi:group II intron reverse transcriptase/maturase
VEGGHLAKENALQSAATRVQDRRFALNALWRVREAAIRDKNLRFTSLLHYVDESLLREAYWALNPDAAPGVDGVTWQEYGNGLAEKLRNLKDRVHRGTYRAQPSRRIYIPKADGRERPLGIASLEDKVVQQAVVTVLNQIYEVDFLGFSYGMRPGRNQHKALDALWVAFMDKKVVRWVLDADIRSFFDTIDHRWAMKFFEHRIADRRVLRLIQKWLRAGVSEDGEWSKTTVGTPQGAVISPLIANVYLHYALDLWVETWRHKRADGDVAVVRFADDFVVGFERKLDAEAFQRELRVRLQKFGLELHPEKTRLIEFGRYAQANRERRGLGKPETFVFLGFTHFCTRYSGSPRGIMRRRTASKRMVSKLHEVKKELRKRRHLPVPDQGKWLGSVVRGFYNYHAVPSNFEALERFREEAARHWVRSLRSRSQRARRKLTWDRFSLLREQWLPQPAIQHPYPSVRFYRDHPRWEPYAGKPHVRFCPGGAG